MEVYQLALKEANRIFGITQDFPREEIYSLTDQIRRSSRAVNALIAEAWAYRKYKAAFCNKIYQALGEAMETQAWLNHALANQYLNQNNYAVLDAVWQKIGGRLTRMVQKADTFVNAGK